MREKYTIPQHVRKLVRIEIGDILEADVEGGRITFTPKNLVDRHLSQGLEDARNGRTHGPYDSAEAAMAALESRAKDRVNKRRP